MMNNFNLIAPVYDSLAKLVFGNKLKQAQCHFLHLIPKDSNVLIVGGGTGWILDEIFKTGFIGSITYVEASSKMLELTQKRLKPEWNVTLINGNESKIPLFQYDTIITNFFLDVFPPEKLQDVIMMLFDRLKNSGIWICTDFQSTNRRLHKLLIWLMHWFFRLTTGIESQDLSDFNLIIHQCGLNLISSFEMKDGLIFSSVFKNEIT